MCHFCCWDVIGDWPFLVVAPSCLSFPGGFIWKATATAWLPCLTSPSLSAWWPIADGVLLCLFYLYVWQIATQNPNKLSWAINSHRRWFARTNLSVSSFCPNRLMTLMIMLPRFYIFDFVNPLVTRNNDRLKKCKKPSTGGEQHPLQHRGVSQWRIMTRPVLSYFRASPKGQWGR